MKKFVSILTVVAMVAALCTSAFAATYSPTSPLEPGQLVEYDDGDFNRPDASDDQPAATVPAPTTPATAGDAAAGGAEEVAPAAGGGDEAAAGTTTTSTTSTSTGTSTGTSAGTTTSSSSDASSESPNAKLEDYDEDSPAYLLVSMLIDLTKVVSVEELLKALGLESPFEKMAFCTNALAMKNAKGVRVTKLDNGKTQVTVGQNQVTEGKNPKDLRSIVAPNKSEKKAEICDIDLDAAKNLQFETQHDEGSFVVASKVE